MTAHVADVVRTWVWRSPSVARAKVFALQFGSAMLVTLLLWQGAAWVYRYLQAGQATVAVRAQNAALAQQISSHFAYFATTLFMVARDPGLRDLIAQGERYRASVTERFRIAVEENREITQLRYIDANGQEVVRVDRVDGAATARRGDELQNKGQRYYFIKASQLAPGELYVSPLDLNVENGAIQTPWVPTIRMATPLRTADGAAAGVVIVNLSAEQVVDMFRPGIGSRNVHAELVNGNGYYLAGAPRSALWGFMFGRDIRIANDRPDLWSALIANGSGEYRKDGRIVAFRTVQAQGGVIKAIGQPHKVHADDVLRVISQNVPRDGAGGHLAITLFALALALLAAVAWNWSGAIVERKRARAAEAEAGRRLEKSEKMAALGSLVAGVAHELNTPIGNAVTIASTMTDQIDEFDQQWQRGSIRRSTIAEFTEAQRSGTRMMLSGLARAAELIVNFKQVAVDQSSEQRRQFELDPYVDEVVAAVRPSLKHAPAELRLRLGSGLRLDGYPGPLGQVIMNLVINAATHAFDADDAGTITVSSRGVDRGTAEIVVADDGNGIAPEHLERVFDPFFTTRMGQGGSGLGLSIVHNIVTGLLGGSINVHSTVGEGTTFTIHLPVTAPRSR